MFNRFACIVTLTAAPLLFPVSQAAVVVTGRIVDETGAPVNGARVVATKAGLPDAVSESDPAGAFRLDVDEAGVYQLRVEREGYFVFAQPAVTLDGETAVEVQMSHLRELAESVDVHYSPPVIDPQQTSDVRRLNNAEILNIPYPASQDYRSAFSLMPGVVEDNSGQNHFGGGDTNQSDYRLNGFEVSDPASGTLNTRLNVDALQTVEWDASRFAPAEGKGSAGTIDLKTEMGDDHWRFAGTNFFPGLSSQSGWHLNHWSPRVRLSGPIRKGSIWFHNAFETYYVVGIVPGLPGSDNRTRSASGSDLTRIQWNVTPAHILTASFLANLSDNTRNGLSVLTPTEATVNSRQSLFLGTIKDQWMVHGGIVELGFADTRGFLSYAPQGSRTYVVTPFGARGNFFQDQTAWTGRQEWLVNAFSRPMKWYGAHQLQAGADIEHTDLNQTIFRHEYISVRADNSIIRDVQFLGSPQQFKNNVQTYGYALDRWSPVDQLMLEAGFRTQWDEYTGGAPFAPRLAAAWSPGWAGGARFSAGWGIFYDAITLNELALSQEQNSVASFFAPSGALIGGPVYTRYVLSPGQLRLPRFAVTSLSADRKLPWQIYGKLNLISREGSRGFTFEDQQVNPFLNLYVLDNIQRQTYRAAELSFRRTFLAKYEWFASYTRSEARANAVVNYSIANPIFALQTGGPLPWDAPDRVLAWGFAPVEKTWFPRLLQPVIGETDLEILADYRTGFPFSVANDAGNLVGLPNSMRFPDYCTVNVALERRFPFRGYLWAFRVAAVNVFDRSNPNVVNADIDSPQFLRFARGQTRALNVRLRFLGRK